MSFVHSTACCLLVSEGPSERMCSPKTIQCYFLCYIPHSFNNYSFLAFQAYVKIGAFFVNFKPILKEQAKVPRPFHQPTLSLDYQILVVILSTGGRRMRMNSWGFFTCTLSSFFIYSDRFYIECIVKSLPEFFWYIMVVELYWNSLYCFVGLPLIQCSQSALVSLVERKL